MCALHEQETNDAVSEHVKQLMNLLMHAEGPETERDLQVEIEEDGDDMHIEENVGRGRNCTCMYLHGTCEWYST